MTIFLFPSYNFLGRTGSKLSLRQFLAWGAKGKFVPCLVARPALKILKILERKLRVRSIFHGKKVHTSRRSSEVVKISGLRHNPRVKVAQKKPIPPGGLGKVEQKHDRAQNPIVWMWSWDNFPITSWRDPGPNFRWPEVVRTLGRPFRHGKTFPLPHAETRKKISMPGSGSEPLTSSQPDHVSLVMGQVSHYVMTKNRKKCFMSKRPTNILRGFLHLYFSLRIYISYTKLKAFLFSFHRYILLYSAPLG